VKQQACGTDKIKSLSEGTAMSDANNLQGKRRAIELIYQQSNYANK
jgi:hypothetical protein